MAERKEIQVGISDREYTSQFQRIKESADSLARDMISSARAYTTSSKEVIRDIEEQIRSIEKRNRLDKEFRERQVEERFERGDISESQKSRAIEGIRGESKEDKIQTQLLRELIDTVKSTAKEEIRTDRTNVEKRIQASRTVGQRAPAGDEYETLKETLQQDYVGGLGQEEAAQRGGFEAARQGSTYLERVMGSNNVYEAATGVGQEASRAGIGAGGLLGVGGILGALLFGGAAKSIQASQPYEQALMGTSALLGGGVDRFEGFGSKFSAYGYSMDETVSRLGQISRARLTGRGSRGAALESLLLERGLGIDESTIMQLETLGRSDIGGGTTTSNVQSMIAALRRTGVIQGEDMSAVPEYLQSLVQLSNRQLQELGEVNTGVNAKMIAAISNLDDSFQNPQVLNNVISSLRGGLTNAQNPQTEALQYATLSRMTPGASLFDLMKMRENPFAEGNIGYTQNYLNTLESISGGNQDMFFMNIMRQFGVSARIAEKIGRGFQGGNLQDIIGQEFRGEETVDIEGRTYGATGALARSTAKFTNTFQQTGKDIVDSFEKIVGVFNGFNEGTQKLVEKMEENNQAVKDLTETNKEILEKAGEGKSAWYQSLLRSIANPANMP